MGTTTGRSVRPERVAFSLRPNTDEILGEGVDFCPGCHALERPTPITPGAAHPGGFGSSPNTLAHTPITAGGSRLANRLSNSDALAPIAWCAVASWVAA